MLAFTLPVISVCELSSFCLANVLLKGLLTGFLLPSLHFHCSIFSTFLLLGEHYVSLIRCQLPFIKLRMVVPFKTVPVTPDPHGYALSSSK